MLEIFNLTKEKFTYIIKPLNYFQNNSKIKVKCLDKVILYIVTLWHQF